MFSRKETVLYATVSAKVTNEGGGRERGRGVIMIIFARFKLSLSVYIQSNLQQTVYQLFIKNPSHQDMVIENYFNDEQ